MVFTVELLESLARPPSIDSFTSDMKYVDDQYFRNSFTLNFAHNLFHSTEKCFIRKMASQLGIQPAACTSARVLSVNST